MRHDARNRAAGKLVIPDEVPDFVQTEVDRVRVLFKERQTILPMGVVTLPDGRAGIVPMDLSNTEMKELSWLALRNVCARLHAKRAVFVSEAWAVTLSAEECSGAPAPSEHLKRRECVIITVDDALTGCWQASLPIERPADQPADLGAVEITRGASGRISRILPDTERAN